MLGLDEFPLKSANLNEDEKLAMLDSGREANNKGKRCAAPVQQDEAEALLCVWILFLDDEFDGSEMNDTNEPPSLSVDDQTTTTEVQAR